MKTALLHVLTPVSVCLAITACGVFDTVLVDLNYDHYAERRVERFPGFLAMPFNSIVNLGYIVIGLYWLLWHTGNTENKRATYVKDVFALMAITYAPVQWVRLSTLGQLPAVLDQWFTLPIFAWVPVWCRFITHGWQPRYALSVELCSFCSYALVLIHDRGFEAALGCHIAFAVTEGFRTQFCHGDAVSLRYLLQAVASCLGFVVLKLLDHPLSRFWMFRYLTGHFWSKVCDILQFHYCFCFFTHLTLAVRKRKVRTEE